MSAYGLRRIALAQGLLPDAPARPLVSGPQPSRFAATASLEAGQSFGYEPPTPAGRNRSGDRRDGNGRPERASGD